MWPALGLSLLVNMLIFIPWDHIFTVSGFWGFDSNYLSGYSFLELPLEEWMFFICIPYACVFMHHAILYFHRSKRLPVKFTNVLSGIILIVLLISSIIYRDRWYTVINFVYGITLLSLIVWKRNDLLRHYYMTFIFMLIPFFIINGILTGSGIEDPVVWYNNFENIGLRLGTIPVEDTVYAFTLILGNLAMTDFFHQKLVNKR
jgi:lycopene cyclase domain-containing protein